LRIERPAESHSRGWVWLLTLGLVAASAVVAGAWWHLRPKGVEVRTALAQEAAEGPGAERTVLNASGYVTARREATISSKITGKVVDVLVEEGVRVSEGQVLAHLDDSNVSASLQLAQAQLEAAKSTLEETRVRIQLAEKEFERQNRLSTNKVASQADYDQAESALQALKARLLQQQSEIVAAERTLAIWRQQLEDTIIRAPFAGVVTAKNAQPGEMISPMSSGGYTRTGICTIVDMESLEIEVDVNESYINRVKAGQPVEAALDAYPDWKIPCKVIAIIPTADRQKSTVKVRVGFEKLDPRVLPDMAVKVGFQETGTSAPVASRAVAVPKAAVLQEDGRDVVFVVKEGKAERRAVTVSSRGPDQVILSGGAAAGESVVVDPPADLAENAPVRVAAH
jgi:HlyD family secretion protein